ncbi:MAG: NifU family protein [Patescibacteria group bacterium]
MEKIEKEIEKYLDEIRPALKNHGGDLNLINVDQKKGVIKIKLTGACAHCSMADLTIKAGIEAYLKKHLTWLKKVEAI